MGKNEIICRKQTHVSLINVCWKSLCAGVRATAQPYVEQNVAYDLKFCSRKSFENDILCWHVVRRTYVFTRWRLWSRENDHQIKGELNRMKCTTYRRSADNVNDRSISFTHIGHPLSGYPFTKVTLRLSVSIVFPKQWLPFCVTTAELDWSRWFGRKIDFMSSLAAVAILLDTQLFSETIIKLGIRNLYINVTICPDLIYYQVVYNYYNSVSILERLSAKKHLDFFGKIIKYHYLCIDFTGWHIDKAGRRGQAN